MLYVLEESYTLQNLVNCGHKMKAVPSTLFIWTEKNLSNNSPWDFDTVLDTIDPNWFYPDENFCPQSTGSRWRCDSLKQMFKKELHKWKLDTTFKQKKTSATPKFFKQNFSRMDDVGDMNFLSLIAPIFEVQKTWFRNFESKNFYLRWISMGS